MKKNIELSRAIVDLLPLGAAGETIAIAVQEHVANLLSQERKDCADIALAIDSCRGNEKEIAKAILQRDQ